MENLEFINVVERNGEQCVRIDVELPIQTYLKMSNVVYDEEGKKIMYYKELINVAVLKYMDR